MPSHQLDDTGVTRLELPGMQWRIAFLHDTAAKFETIITDTLAQRCSWRSPSNTMSSVGFDSGPTLKQRWVNGVSWGYIIYIGGPSINTVTGRQNQNDCSRHCLNGGKNLIDFAAADSLRYMSINGIRISTYYPGERWTMCRMLLNINFVRTTITHTHMDRSCLSIIELKIDELNPDQTNRSFRV